MSIIKQTGFYLLSPFTMVFALLFILLTPDQPEFDTEKKPARPSVPIVD